MHAPTLPLYGLTSVQMVCVRELAKGRKSKEVRRQFGISAAMWAEWNRDRMFIQALENTILRHDQIVEEALKEGELQASATLIQALAAEVPIKQKGGRIKYLPDWSNRVRAAISLLDRRGERGKPVERVQQANFNFNTQEVRNEITQALADPGVRQFLMQDPTLAAQLRKELSQLALPPESSCDTSESSAPPSSEPPDTSPS